MGRSILDEDHIHPAIREKVAAHHADIVREVQEAISESAVVVVGMAMNPFPRKARRLLDAAHVPCDTSGTGVTCRKWRRRNALKMWTGWPTFRWCS